MTRLPKKLNSLLTACSLRVPSMEHRQCLLLQSKSYDQTWPLSRLSRLNIDYLGSLDVLIIPLGKYKVSRRDILDTIQPVVLKAMR